MRWLVTFALLCGCVEPPVAPVLPPTALQSIEASRDLDGGVVGTYGRPTIVITFASWCSHCHEELATLAALRADHPGVRILGVNYIAHEVYAGRGNAQAVRAYVAQHAPWLRVVPADDALFAVLGRPPLIPTLYVFDRSGALVETYDRRYRAAPSVDELAELLGRLGA